LYSSALPSFALWADYPKKIRKLTKNQLEKFTFIKETCGFKKNLLNNGIVQSMFILFLICVLLLIIGDLLGNLVILFRIQPYVQQCCSAHHTPTLNATGRI
jgi:hypothetical protein